MKGFNGRIKTRFNQQFIFDRLNPIFVSDDWDKDADRRGDYFFAGFRA